MSPVSRCIRTPTASGCSAPCKRRSRASSPGSPGCASAWARRPGSPRRRCTSPLKGCCAWTRARSACSSIRYSRSRAARTRFGMTAVTDDLLLYYERELTYLRQMGAQFAARYPKVAARLQLEPTKCEDPHVERLLEGFAFLAARVHHRLDDDLPEVSEAMLDVLHPQHVRPVPALSLVELELDPELGKLPAGFHVSRGSELQSRPVQGMPCRFRTCYDTTLWPMTVAAAEWTTADRAGSGTRVGEAVGAIRLEVRAFDGMKLGQLA